MNKAPVSKEYLFKYGSQNMRYSACDHEKHVSLLD
jgi:hypothetical protein